MSQNPTYDPEPGYTTEDYSNMASYRQATSEPPSNVLGGNGKSYRYATEPINEDDEEVDTRDVQFSNGGKPTKTFSDKESSEGIWSRYKTHILVAVIIVVSILWVIFMALYLSNLMNGNSSNGGNVAEIGAAKQGTEKTPVTQRPEFTVTTTPSTPTTTAAATESEIDLPDGTKMKKFIMENKNGMKVELLSLGARINKLITPGNRDIVLGFDTEGNNKTNSMTNYNFGATKGRICREISYPVSFDGTNYNLKEAGELFKANFDGVATGEGVKFTKSVGESEDGLPGNADVEVMYALSDNNELKITMTATSADRSLIDLCNAVYFNLDSSNNIEKHKLLMNSDKFANKDNWSVVNGALYKYDQLTELKGGMDIHLQGFGANVDYGVSYRLYGATGLRYAGSLSRDNVEVKMYTNQPVVSFNIDLDGPGVTGKRQYDGKSSIRFTTHSSPITSDGGTMERMLLQPGSVYKNEVVYAVTES